MQESFDFAADDLAFMRRALTRAFGKLQPFERRDPVWRLVRALIGCRTQDEVSESALERLLAHWPHPRMLAVASPDQVEQVLGDVKYASDKAGNLVETLRCIGREHPDYDLLFLASWPVHRALVWLERLPGVGPKVAAATINASTLDMPVFIVDCHVHRILVRYGFIGERASAERGRNAVTGLAASLSSEDLLEFFTQMKRLGREYCGYHKRNCPACPLTARCMKKDWPKLGHPGFRRPHIPPKVASFPGGTPFRV